MKKKRKSQTKAAPSTIRNYYQQFDRRKPEKKNPARRRFIFAWVRLIDISDTVESIILFTESNHQFWNYEFGIFMISCLKPIKLSLLTLIGMSYKSKKMFCKTQMSFLGCQIDLNDVNFHLQKKFWKCLIKIRVTKSDSLMPIRVKERKKITHQTCKVLRILKGLWQSC